MTTERTLPSVGWRVYGLGVIALAVVCLALGDFPPGQPVPKNFPDRTALAYAVGTFMLVAARPSSGVGPRHGAPRRSLPTTRSLLSS
jgi:hypothetical protein